MAAGDRIFMAKESTSQEILSNTKKIIEDAKAKPKRYGMRINLLDSNPATRVKYLYDAVGMTPAGMNFAGGGFDYGDWGDIWFVKKNRPVMVRTDGTVDYELNHENHALKLNGGASDITKTSYGGNAMSEIPLIWVKRWTQNNYHFVVFCEEQYDDTYKAYAHTDADGNVLPVTYFPMYEGSVVNNRMRSLSGLTPTASMTDEQETTAAKQNGDRWDKQSFSEINLMYEMCTMITCSTNSQGKFGNGNSQSDNFLQTGTLNGKGQFFGYTSTTQAVKVFYCENFFANYWKRLRGLLLINGVYHVKAVPPYNSTGAGYTNTGLTPSGTSGGYCSRMEMASDMENAMRMVQAASMDDMTGLYSKNKLLETVEHMEPKERPVAVIYWDVNPLKYVNDTFGHLYGDQLIAKIAGSIRAAVTSEETNAYRYGGDEFLMIIPDGTQEIAEDVIEKWRQVMKPIQKNSEIPVSASVGYAVGKYENIMELIEIADQRMYKDKQLRRQ